MYFEDTKNIESLLKALKDAVDEKEALNKRIIALDRDLHMQLLILNRTINRELRLTTKKVENTNAIRGTIRELKKHTLFLSYTLITVK
jgi:hypothetical protein